MANYKVAFVNPLKDYVERFIATAPKEFTVKILPNGTDVAEICREVSDADFCIMGIDVPEEVFRAAKKAKFIQYLSSGFGQLSTEVLNELGIPVAQMKAHSISVAEHAVALMLMSLRRMVPTMREMREGKWRPDLDETSYSELYGKTVGIVGLGNIGRWIGRIVHYGFGANVIFYDNADIPLTVAELIAAKPVSLEELMRESDVVSLSVPLNKESDRMIGAEQIKLMKSRGVLVNICRGEVVDQNALIEALQEHRIAGAGLDVYEKEPLSLDCPLLKMEQVVCTPHMAGTGWENVERRATLVWKNIDLVLQGEIPTGVITTTKRANKS